MQKLRRSRGDLRRGCLHVEFVFFCAGSVRLKYTLASQHFLCPEGKIPVIPVDIHISLLKYCLKLFALRILCDLLCINQTVLSVSKLTYHTYHSEARMCNFQRNGRLNLVYLVYSPGFTFQIINAKSLICLQAVLHPSSCLCTLKVIFPCLQFVIIILIATTVKRRL